MFITTTRLTRWAGLSAVAAGLLFIGVQVNHPPLNAATITTTEMTLRRTAKLLTAVLALAGITGIYLDSLWRDQRHPTAPAATIRVLAVGPRAEP